MGGEHSLPDFSSIKYTRPDIEAYTELVKDVRLRLMTAQTAEQAVENHQLPQRCSQPREDHAHTEENSAGKDDPFWAKPVVDETA